MAAAYFPWDLYMTSASFWTRGSRKDTPQTTLPNPPNPPNRPTTHHGAACVQVFPNNKAGGQHRD